ncbi:MAG TPA: hypothetical protein VJM33_17335 [Microthrixaceae bacterium]|nr:hypothetical protein [Microthrixaceae bacterium]
MTAVVLDDHLLRDLLAKQQSPGLTTLLRTYEPATTNLYYVRLCRSAVNARGSKLTGAWPAALRQSLAQALVALPATVRIVPMRDLAFRIAELAGTHKLSTLGAEAVAAAEHLGGPLAVWDGDVGPQISSAASAVGSAYHAVAR